MFPYWFKIRLTVVRTEFYDFDHKSDTRQLACAVLGLSMCVPGLPRQKCPLMSYRWSLVRIHKLRLPFPSWVASMEIVLTLVVVAAVWSWDRATLEHQRRKLTNFMFYATAYVVLLASVGLATWCAINAFAADISSCTLELQWKRWFQNKNANAIRSVQNHFHCCGFNSMKDRAWPFPSRQNDADTCQKMFDFSTHCRPLWHSEMRFVAIASLVASLTVHCLVASFYS